MATVPFAEWRPDAAELNSQFTGDVNNVLCAAGSYLPFPAPSELTGALAAKPLGAFVARSLNGQVTVFVGTVEKLYVMDNTDLTWTDVSKTGATYNANDTARWDFEQFGEYVVAVNVNDDPQVFQLGVSTEFADLGGSPPRAHFVKAWGDFLCLMQLANNPNRVHWSGLNDITSWTPGTANSDYQDFPEGGVVQGSSRATNPVILMQRAVYVGTFVPGSAVIFTFRKAHDAIGAASPYSIATRGEYLFCADVGAFRQFGPDGSQLAIGFEKVDRTFFGQLASADIASIQGAIDPFYSRVYWALDVGGTGIYNTILVHDWDLQRWSRAGQNALMLFPAATAGYTMEGLDSLYASLDAMPFSLDSKVWQGGAPVLAAFTSDYKLAFFNGEAKEATITTQEQGDLAGGVTFINAINPVVDAENVLVSIGSRFRRSDQPVWTDEAAKSANTGIVRKRSRGRYNRVRVRIPAGERWTHAQGVEIVNPRASGKR